MFYAVITNKTHNLSNLMTQYGRHLMCGVRDIIIHNEYWFQIKLSKSKKELSSFISYYSIGVIQAQLYQSHIDPNKVIATALLLPGSPFINMA